MPMQKGVNKARTSERTDFEDLSDLTWSPSVGMGMCSKAADHRRWSKGGRGIPIRNFVDAGSWFSDSAL